MEEEQKYERLFNDIDSQALITLGIVLLSAIVLIIVSQRLLNWVGNRMHGQVRFRIFAMVPMTRLLILITALAIIVPTIIEPSLRNMVTVMGGVGPSHWLCHERLCQQSDSRRRFSGRAALSARRLGAN